MKVFEAPQEYQGGGVSLFLGGGITGCPDWQADIIYRLRNTELILLNPRRSNFPINDPEAALEQVPWEFRHLRKSTANIFWFAKETICPIVLYELGAHSIGDKPLFVGTHPDYARRLDVELQTKLARPEIEVVHSLESIEAQIREWAQTVR